MGSNFSYFVVKESLKFLPAHNSDRGQIVHLTLCFTKFATSVLRLSATMNKVDIMFSLIVIGIVSKGGSAVVSKV